MSKDAVADLEVQVSGIVDGSQILDSSDREIQGRFGAEFEGRY